MVRTRLLMSLIIFAMMLFCISIVKNKSRIIEKSIESLSKKISLLLKMIYMKLNLIIFICLHQKIF